MDAELSGGLPQPDLAGELVGLLGQLSVLPVGVELREAVAAKPAVLARPGAAEHAVICVDPAGGRRRYRVVIEIIHGTFGLGDEPLEVVVSIRPATGNVLVFETYEGAAGEDETTSWPGRPAAIPPAHRRHPA